MTRYWKYQPVIEFSAPDSKAAVEEIQQQLFVLANNPQDIAVDLEDENDHTEA